MQGDLHLCELKNLSSVIALMHTLDYVWSGRYYDLLLCAGLDTCALSFCVYAFPRVEKLDVRPKHDQRIYSCNKIQYRHVYLRKHILNKGHAYGNIKSYNGNNTNSQERQTYEWYSKISHSLYTKTKQANERITVWLEESHIWGSI
jgi:hypothetical protein